MAPWSDWCGFTVSGVPPSNRPQIIPSTTAITKPNDRRAEGSKLACIVLPSPLHERSMDFASVFFCRPIDANQRRAPLTRKKYFAMQRYSLGLLTSLRTVDEMNLARGCSFLARAKISSPDTSPDTLRKLAISYHEAIVHEGAMIRPQTGKRSAQWGRRNISLAFPDLLRNALGPAVLASRGKIYGASVKSAEDAFAAGSRNCPRPRDQQGPQRGHTHAFHRTTERAR